MNIDKTNSKYEELITMIYTSYNKNNDVYIKSNNINTDNSNYTVKEEIDLDKNIHNLNRDNSSSDKNICKFYDMTKDDLVNYIRKLELVLMSKDNDITNINKKNEEYIENVRELKLKTEKEISDVKKNNFSLSKENESLKEKVNMLNAMISRKNSLLKQESLVTNIINNNNNNNTTQKETDLLAAAVNKINNSNINLDNNNNNKNRSSKKEFTLEDLRFSVIGNELTNNYIKNKANFEDKKSLDIIKNDTKIINNLEDKNNCKSVKYTINKEELDINNNNDNNNNNNNNNNNKLESINEVNEDTITANDINKSSNINSISKTSDYLFEINPNIIENKTNISNSNNNQSLDNENTLNINNNKDNPFNINKDAKYNLNDRGPSVFENNSFDYHNKISLLDNKNVNNTNYNSKIYIPNLVLNNVTNSKDKQIGNNTVNLERNTYANTYRQPMGVNIQSNYYNNNNNEFTGFTDRITEHLNNNKTINTLTNKKEDNIKKLKRLKNKSNLELTSFEKDRKIIRQETMKSENFNNAITNKLLGYNNNSNNNNNNNILSSSNSTVNILSTKNILNNNIIKDFNDTNNNTPSSITCYDYLNLSKDNATIEIMESYKEDASQFELFSDHVFEVKELSKSRKILFITGKSIYLLRTSNLSIKLRIDIIKLEKISLSTTNTNMLALHIRGEDDVLIEVLKRIELIQYFKDLIKLNTLKKSYIKNFNYNINLQFKYTDQFKISRNGKLVNIIVNQGGNFFLSADIGNSRKLGYLHKYYPGIFGGFYEKLIVLSEIGVMVFDDPNKDKVPKQLLAVSSSFIYRIEEKKYKRKYCFEIKEPGCKGEAFACKNEEEVNAWLEEFEKLKYDIINKNNIN